MIQLIKQAGVVYAFNKPAGLSSSGYNLEDPDCVQYKISQQLKRPIWLCHQLDKGTSGVLLCVLRKNKVQLVQEAMQKKSCVKRYIALVHGEVDFISKKIDARLIYDRNLRKTVLSPDGKRAVSCVTLLEKNDRFSLLQVDIKTGRTHQIRAHLESIGHSLVGEDRYRKETCELLEWPALHCQQIRMELSNKAGRTHQKLEFYSKLPDVLKNFCKAQALID